MRRRIPALALGLSALVPALLLGYGTALHDLFPRAALVGLEQATGPVSLADTLPGISDADLPAFRRWLYDRAAALPDTALGRRFRARYPSEAAFDARAFREFLMMDGADRVLGVDSFAAVYGHMRPADRAMDPHPPYVAGRRIPLLTVLQMGSIYPDLDRRNQNRLARSTDGRVMLTPAGDTVPFDPMTLNLGNLTGLSSQAHAHYGLSRAPKSSDPATLKTRPWDFAVATGFPGPVETYAPDNAQLYTDLALLATLAGRPSWRTLGALWAGNAFHYIADCGNAVHTVQVGVYDIFVDATMQSWIRRITSLFGLLGRAPSRNAIGIDILTSLHTGSERIFQMELLDAVRAARSGDTADLPAGMDRVLAALHSGDDSLRRVLSDTLDKLGAATRVPDFGRAIASVVVDANVRDGADVYRITRGIVDPRLRKGRVALDFDTIPDAAAWRWIAVDRRTGLAAFNAVHARGVARTIEALRTWWKSYRRAATTPPSGQPAIVEAVTSRLVRERLAYLDAAEARRRIWLSSHTGARTP